MRGENDHPHVRIRVADPVEGKLHIDAGKVHIEQHEICPEPLNLCHQLRTRRHLAHALDPGHAFERPLDPRTNQAVPVSHQQPHLQPQSFRSVRSLALTTATPNQPPTQLSESTDSSLDLYHSKG